MSSASISEEISHTMDEETQRKSDYKFEMGKMSTATYIPTHFMKGTQVKTTDGLLKKVEEVCTDDFLKSASESSEVAVNASVIREVQKSPCNNSVIITFQVGVHLEVISLKAQCEHPFYVLGKGWCSCEPTKTAETYGLETMPLEVGDVCMVLTKKSATLEGTVSLALAQRQIELSSKMPSVGERCREESSNESRRSVPPRSSSFPRYSSRKRKSHSG
ncbi:unnamed protein product [Caenorhabditis auriculariae]|uniref:AXH domain-containing protein n=1 Tax=Caenorhabditis auriculariae TaxID=2777116 RepID=A0A8S1GLU8_9PELO|nr:unnamed protein product [Caenorhabditis auriculariae]